MSPRHVAKHTSIRLWPRQWASHRVFGIGMGIGTRSLHQVAETHGRISIESFQNLAIRADKPLVLRVQDRISDDNPAAHSRDAVTLGATGTTGVPSVELAALTKWFHPESGLTPYLEGQPATFVEYELMIQPAGGLAPKQPVYEFIEWLSRSGDGMHNSLAQLLQEVVSDTHFLPKKAGPKRARFLRFQAPLSLLVAGLKFNQQSVTTKLGELYVAQTPLGDLAPELMCDLPVPNLVKQGAKGQLYNSSIWMGLQPTYTPWHRDPNLNLFVQLCGVKRIRLCPPRAGLRLYLEVQNTLNAINRARSSNIRGVEMMSGEERDKLHKVVWADEANCDPKMYEVTQLNPGDALFIPQEWWHSVQSVGPQGDLNASVNWWFR